MKKICNTLALTFTLSLLNLTTTGAPVLRHLSVDSTVDILNVKQSRKRKTVLALTYVSDTKENKHAKQLLSQYFKNYKLKTTDMRDKYASDVYGDMSALEQATIAEIDAYKAHRGAAPDYIVFFGHGARLNIIENDQKIIDFANVCSKIKSDSTHKQAIILMGCNTFGDLTPQTVLRVRDIAVDNQLYIYGTITPIRSNLGADAIVHGHTMVFTPDGDVDSAALFNGATCATGDEKSATCPSDIHEKICTRNEQEDWAQYYKTSKPFNDEFFDHMAAYGR